MASSASGAGAQQTPTRHRSRWSLDFNPSRSGSRGGGDVAAAPPGYSLGNQQVMNPDAAGRAGENNNANLRAKRSWDTALAPVRQAPMNLFAMYMSGNSIYAFPLIMALAVRPLKTLLLSTGTTFKQLDADAGAGAASALGQKIVFVLGNLANVALAVCKFYSMGLLPTYVSDWLALADPISRIEWAYVAS